MSLVCFEDACAGGPGVFHLHCVNLRARRNKHPNCVLCRYSSANFTASVPVQPPLCETAENDGHSL